MIIRKLTTRLVFIIFTRNPEDALLDSSDDERLLDERDLQPELYNIEDRNKETFDEFDGYDKSVEKFKKSLSFFKESDKENSFFDVVMYGPMFKWTEDKNISRDRALGY